MAPKRFKTYSCPHLETCSARTGAKSKCSTLDGLNWTAVQKHAANKFIHAKCHPACPAHDWAFKDDDLVIRLQFSSRVGTPHLRTAEHRKEISLRDAQGTEGKVKCEASEPDPPTKINQLSTIYPTTSPLQFASNRWIYQFFLAGLLTVILFYGFDSSHVFSCRSCAGHLLPQVGDILKCSLGSPCKRVWPYWERKMEMMCFEVRYYILPLFGLRGTTRFCTVLGLGLTSVVCICLLGGIFVKARGNSIQRNSLVIKSF